MLTPQTMSDVDPRTATRLLRAWRDGDARAMDRLLPLVYDELRKLARQALRGERGGHTLQSRALVHEAYLRLVDADVTYTDRAHFMALAARTMRRVLVDHARAKSRHKRGGDNVRVPLEDVHLPAQALALDIIDLNDAIDRLAVFDRRKADVVELHFFGGLNYDETAEAVGVSAATVDRELRLAKAWLRHELSGAAGA